LIRYREVIMFGLGLPEMIVVLVVALLVFGPSKLPSLGKSLGEAIRGFKKGLEEDSPEQPKLDNQTQKPEK
jgi:sec-independent protein translocase protein TatA